MVLDIVKDKETRTLNHMEQNVYAALQDLPTLHEFCALALFSQSVSHHTPYMRRLRGVGQQNLGPLRAEIHSFMKKITQDPDILLAPDATYLTASFDAMPWDRPEAFYAIQPLTPTLPHLRGILVAFFEGASETWERFTAEFHPGGIIANASPEIRRDAWVPTTNDANEGALGSARVSMRQYPSISQHQLNARTCYKRNHTSDYIEANLGSPERTHLRKQAAHLMARPSKRDDAASRLHIASLNYKIPVSPVDPPARPD